MNSYNPISGNRKKLPQRKSIRLKGYDYSQAGLYFITICCQDRIYRFGDVIDGKMIFNEYGEIAHNEWIKLTERFPNMEMDAFQIMPNHMHGIIALSVRATLTVAQNNGIAQNDVVAQNTVTQNDMQPHINDGQLQGIAPMTISDIVGAYKSLVANGCLEIYKSKNKIMGKLWQRNYYEHIIRNEKSYQYISEYIINNPTKWANDKFYTK